MTTRAADTVEVGDLFKHFKGTLYRVIDLTWACEGEEPVARIVYDRFDGTRTFETGHPSRTVENFLEEVERPELSYKGPRFVFVR